jgi:hypothetical protein
MSIWLWCPGVDGRCAVCKAMVTGLWRHFVSDSTSDKDVCASCADAL